MKQFAIRLTKDEAEIILAALNRYATYLQNNYRAFPEEKIKQINQIIERINIQKYCEEDWHYWKLGLNTFILEKHLYATDAEKRRMEEEIEEIKNRLMPPK